MSREQELTIVLHRASEIFKRTDESITTFANETDVATLIIYKDKLEKAWGKYHVSLEEVESYSTDSFH